MKNSIKYLFVAASAALGSQAGWAADHSFNGAVSTYEGEVLSGNAPALNWSFVNEQFTFEIAAGFIGLAGDAMGGAITLRGKTSATTITGLSVSGFGALTDMNNDLSDGFQFSLSPLLALTPYTVTVSGNVSSLNLATSAAYYDVQATAVVPEPEGFALALASLGVLGAVGTRRHSRR